ncbi:MAG: plastocyanin/azurin family copper-binding protein [Sulfurimonas sp.]|nr:plastocyanin/azurin family copper-binding protein [Sulfurimonas sp.]MDQ7059932.1 plastocyanin/azurin family copper-binding protein [Sulfurimonas sp.]
MKNIILSLLVASSLFAVDHVIDQKGKTFIPHAITVAVGDTLTFKNSDPFAHNAYTDDEANEFDTGMQSPGKPVSAKVLAAGVFNVECAIHPNMLLEVTAK